MFDYFSFPEKINQCTHHIQVVEVQSTKNPTSFQSRRHFETS